MSAKKPFDQEIHDRPRHEGKKRRIRLTGRDLLFAVGHDRAVQDHVDLKGASGAVYRFRLIADPNRLPISAGNFTYVRWRGSTPQVMCCGAVNSLVEAVRQWDLAVRSHGAEGLYIRLNVARSTRTDEHRDLIERLRPPMASPDH